MKYESKNKDFGKRLKQLRDQKKLEQIEAASKIGVGYRSLQNHEGGRWPNKNNLQKYLDFYNCDREWLLTGQGDAYPYEQKETPPVEYKQTEDMPSNINAPESDYDLHGGWKPRQYR